MFNPQLRLGILGGGQLGRMLLQSAIDFDLHVRVLDPDPDAPCRWIAPEFVQGSFRDFETVYAFGKDCDLITIEIESVNLDALKQLQAEGKRVFPQPEVIEIIQDKRTQKQFYAQHGLPTADFVLTDTLDDVRANVAFLPAFHKLGKGGYDGRGVQRLSTAADVHLAFDEPSLLEKAIDFVEYLFAPAEISSEVEEKANKISQKIAEKLGIVGLLAVEMFVTRTGDVLINEVAPRPHNSGHHTIRANSTSQFEQHIRAIMGWALGSTAAHSPAAMVNLLGEEGHTGEAHYAGMDDLLAMPGVHPFLYGKKFTKPYRKMGHVTVMDKDLVALKAKTQRVKQTISVVAKPAVS
jgi:5-(carboxyamino)imidazole ribonucleotide synthase